MNASEVCYCFGVTDGDEDLFTFTKSETSVYSKRFEDTRRLITLE